VFFKGCNLRCKWCANPESQGKTSKSHGTAANVPAAEGAKPVAPTGRSIRWIQPASAAAPACPNALRVPSGKKDAVFLWKRWRRKS
jgi:pyruvate-formate lyase-activating enzyme